jgi:2-phospho-L-lactate guanylyltransferase
VLWTLLVPVKVADAKSRLAATLPHDAAPRLHARLVAAMRTDALAAATATAQVARVVVITDEPLPDVDAEVLVQTSAGLNGALQEGADYAARRWPDTGLAALVGDLPALRREELGAALDEAARHEAAFVPDTTGTGTTLLAARPGVALRPQFGVNSATRHAKHAVPLLSAGPGLRCDVDTAEDLEAAFVLGVGPATSAAGDVTPRSP